jgi:hypothetical protein
MRQSMTEFVFGSESDGLGLSKARSKPLPQICPLFTLQTEESQFAEPDRVRLETGLVPLTHGLLFWPDRGASDGSPRTTNDLRWLRISRNMALFLLRLLLLARTDGFGCSCKLADWSSGDRNSKKRGRSRGIEGGEWPRRSRRPSAF